MTQEEINRIHHIKNYLDGWDWNVEPWFVIPEKDAKVLSKVLEKYENNLVSKRLQAQRRRARNDQK